MGGRGLKIKEGKGFQSSKLYSVKRIPLSNQIRRRLYIEKCVMEEKFDLQGKVEDSDILLHVGKLRKEFKLILKTRCYKEIV
ncbi:hypothetical protein V6Z12_D12G095500 [Gossypium hirsutum]